MVSKLIFNIDPNVGLFDLVGDVICLARNLKCYKENVVSTWMKGRLGTIGSGSLHMSDRLLILIYETTFLFGKQYSYFQNHVNKWKRQSYATEDFLVLPHFCC